MIDVNNKVLLCFGQYRTTVKIDYILIYKKKILTNKKVKCLKNHSFKFFILSRKSLTVSLPLMRSEAFSPIIIQGALVFPDVKCLITEPSATRKPDICLTLKQYVSSLKLAAEP